MNQAFDWDDVRLFLSLVRNGSVRGASRHLGLSHATVSRRLTLFEEKLGVQLFDRSDRGLTPNLAGRDIVSIAETVEAQMAEMDRRLFNRVDELAGPVRLSVSESLYLTLLDKEIDRFMTLNPMIELQLDTTDDMARLDRREADVVVRITKAPPPHLVGREMAESPLCCYGSKAYFAAQPALDRWISILYPAAKDPMVPARVAALCSSAVAAHRMIKNGAGVGMLPCYMGDTDPYLVRYPGLTPVPDQTIWVLTHTDIRKNPRVRRLLDFLFDSLHTLKPIIEGHIDTAVGL